MFNLESEISKWRAGLAATGLSREAADELENHLRDDIQRSLKDSPADEVAFELAKLRLGTSGEIKREFDRADPTTRFLWIPRWGKFVLGTAIAAALLVGASFLLPRPWHSEAKILVKYAVTSPSGEAIGAFAKSLDERGAMLMETQSALLTSLDLADQVAAAVGPERITGSPERALAARTVREGIKVQIPRFSTVLQVTFEHQDPQVVQIVLREVIDRYERLVGTDRLGSGPNSRKVGIQIIESATPPYRRTLGPQTYWVLGGAMLLGLMWVGFDLFRSRRKPPSNPPSLQPSA